MGLTATVYLVTNTVNGKRYIGVTRFTVKKRWAQHRYAAGSGRKTRLYDAIRKYGVEAFTVQTIASCVSSPSEVERLVVKQEKPEYNQTNGGEITTGRRVAPEVVAKIVAANMGKKRTLEQRAANAARKKAQYASDPVLRAKLVANAAKANAVSAKDPKRIQAVSTACRNRIWTPEMRAKLSASCVEKYRKLKIAGE